VFDVSLVIPTHNRPHLLSRAVESARRAGTSVEIVVVDDASADGTADVCRALEGINYVRVERRQGVAGARNIGLLAATADVVGFLDDDDLRLPGSLDVQLEILRAAPEAGMVYGQMFIGDASGGPLGAAVPTALPTGDVFWDLLANNFVPCQGALFRRACLLRVGLLDPEIPGLDDWDLWIRISELYPVLALEQPVSVWCRRLEDPTQMSADKPYMIRLGERLLRQRWLRLPRAQASSPAACRRIHRRYRAGSTHFLLEGAAVQLIRHRRPLAASRQVAAACRLDLVEVMRSLFHRDTRRIVRDLVAPSQSPRARAAGPDR